MAGKSDLKLYITAVTDKLKSGLADAEKDLEGFRDQANAMGKSMMKAGGMMTAGITVPIIAGLGMATKAAAEEQKEMAVLEQVLRNTAKATDAQVASVEEWITAAQNASGVADTDLRAAYAKLMVGGRSVTQVQDDLAVAMDIAAARGLDLATVSNAMAKAAQGNTGALGRLGIATRDAAGNALTYDEILANANKTMGGASEAAAGTAEGKLKILQLRFEDMKETVGAALMPVLERLVGWITKAADWFSKLSPTAQKFALIGAIVAAAIGPVVTIVGALVTAFSVLSLPIIAVVAALAAVAAAVVYLYRNNEDFREGVHNLIEKMRELWAKIQEWWPAIKQTISDAMQTVSAIVSEVIAGIKVAWAMWGDELISQAKNVWNTIAGIIEGFVSIFDGVIDLVRALVDGDWAKAWEAVKQIASGAFTVIWSAATGIVTSIGNVLSAIWSAIGNTIASAVNTVIGHIESVINFAIDGVNTLIAGVNLVNPGEDVKKLGRVTLGRVGVSAPSPANAGGGHYGAMNARPMAAGGIVKARPGGIIAQIGEGNYDEAVVPLKPGMGLGNTINITVNAGMGADGAAISDMIVTKLSEWTRRNGPLNGAVRVA